jgi:peptidoglycan/LPS O-acetylase OafA/YrhL
MPYLLFFSFSFFLFHLIIKKDGFDIAVFLKGLLSGSQPVLKETTGFYFLWFLPAFFAVTFLRMVFDNVNWLFKVLIILFSVFLHVILSWSAREELFNSIPFALTQGFYYFAFGIIASYLLNYIPHIKYLGAFIFILISIAFFMGHEINIPFLFPIGFVMFSLSVLKLLSTVPYLDKLGQYSLPIYLIHVYLYNGFERLFPYTIIFGIINLIITVILSYFLSTIMLNTSCIRKLMFPRDWNEIKTFYHK